MKKLLLILLCIQSWIALAAEGAIDWPCTRLNIEINNKTQSACYLTGLDLVSGMVWSAELNNLPLYIPANGIGKSFIVREDNRQTNIVLTYRCGENKTVTIQSQKGSCAQNAVVYGKVLSITNLDISSETNNGLYWDSKPGEITWTISDLLA